MYGELLDCTSSFGGVNVIKDLESPCEGGGVRPNPTNPPGSATDFRLTYSFTPPVTSSFSDSPLCTSVIPSFTPGFKPTCFTNPTPPSPQAHFFLPDCLHGLFPGPFLLSYSVFVFSFSLFFVYAPCARLGWSFRQLLSVR